MARLNHLLCSIQCSLSVVSDSLQPHRQQHSRLPFPSPSPRACSKSCPLSQWCHPTISSSVIPFSSCLQYFPASGSFPMSQLFTSGGLSFGASASVSVPSMNIQDWFPLGLTGLTSLQSKGLSRVFSSTTVQQRQFLRAYLSLWSSSHLYMTSVPCQTMTSTIWTFVGRVMSLFFNMLSRFVIAFLPSSMLLVTSWLHSPSTVTLELRKIVCHCFHCFPTYLPWSDGTGCHDFSVLNVES